MPTEVTVTDNRGSLKHDINFKGISGFLFYLLLAGTILFLIAFFTEGWMEVNNLKIGLWKACTCSADHSITASWYRGSQAVLALAVAVISAGLYMFLHQVNKNSLIIALIASTTTAGVLLLVGVAVFGASSAREIPAGHHSYSFAFACVSTVLCLAAAALATVQLLHARNAAA